MGRVARGAQGRAGVHLPGWLTAVVMLEVVAFGLALALSVAVAAHGDPFAGELRIAGWIQGFPSWFEPIARGMRLITTQVVLAAGAGVALSLWLMGRRWEAAVLAAALVTLAVLQPVIKNLVDRPRPDPSLVERRAGFSSESFPSGHMMSSFVLVALLAVIAWGRSLRRNARAAIVAAVVALFVLNGASSLYLGLHWPSDIAGGVLWGAVIVLPAATAIWVRTEGARGGPAT